MKKRKFDWIGLFTGLGELLVGILLFISPETFTSGLVIAAGALLGLLGVKSLYDYFRDEPEKAAAGNGCLMGSGFLLAGVLCLFLAKGVGETPAVLTTTYGAAILFAGLIELQDTVNMLRLKFEKWYVSASSSGVAAVAALVLFLNPFGEDLPSIYTFTAVALVLKAGLDLVGAFVGRPFIAEKKEEPKEEEKEEEKEEKETKIKVKVKEKAKEN